MGKPISLGDLEKRLLTKANNCALIAVILNRKDVDGKLASFESDREPAVGASRCGRWKRSGS